MTKLRFSITMDPGVLDEADQEARAAGMSRSEWLEKIVHEAHIRAMLDRYHPPGGVEETPPEVAERARAVREWWAAQDEAGGPPGRTSR